MFYFHRYHSGRIQTAAVRGQLWVALRELQWTTDKWGISLIIKWYKNIEFWKNRAGNELTNKFLLQPQDTSEDTYQIGDAVVDEATFHVTLDSVTSTGGGASNTDR